MLTKKDRKKRYNKKFPKTGAHTFEGFFDKMTTKTQEAFKGDNLGGAIGGIASAATGAINTGMEAAKLQGVEEAQADIDKQAAFQSTATTQDDLLAEMAGAVNIKSDYNRKDFMQSGGDFAKSMVSGALQGAASGASAGPWGAVAGAAASLISGAIGRGAASAKAQKKAVELNEAARKANLAKAQTLTAKAGALDQAADQRALAAYAAYGGDINASKFPDYPSEVTEFNAGGSHEENPYDGIPQGIAPDGLPNLVEEGEVKFDNYIFSDRLMLNKNDKKKYKFLKGKTYADAAKAIKKELGIDERPNDLIAKTDLEEQLNLLSILQEEKRAKRGLRGENRMMYAKGGHLFANGSRQEIRDYMANGFTRREARNLAKGNFNLDSPTFDWSSTLQAAPAIGNVIGTMTSLFDKPTYEHTTKLTKSEDAITPITYTPTHQDIRLDRFDTNYHANKLSSQAGAARRAIREQTASNPYAATAALLSADANAQSQMGDLYRKAAEYNQGIALQEAQFNEAGRRADAEGFLKADSANASLLDKALTRQAEKDIYAARLNMAEDQAWDTANSANMTSLFDNIGAIGKERASQTQAALKLLGDGITYTDAMLPLLEDMLGPTRGRALAEILKQKTSKGSTGKTTGKAYGGKLQRKKGYTI